MWIRSQDKEKFADLRVFDISRTGYTNMPYKICGYSDDWANTNNFHIDLAHYSSKEKALKVLDMIQEHIKSMYVGTGNYMGYPFQMPQDDEV